MVGMESSYTRKAVSILLMESFYDREAVSMFVTGRSRHH
jgi:hypothetical protein